MMYVLVQLRDTYDTDKGTWGKLVDKPLFVARSAATLLHWAMTNYELYRYTDGVSCDTVWSALAKINGETCELACFEVEKI